MNELEIRGLREMIKEEVEEQLTERIDELRGDTDADGEEEEEDSGEDSLPPESEEEEEDEGIEDEEADQGGEDGKDVADAQAPEIVKSGQQVSKEQMKALNKPKNPKLVPTSIKEEEKWEDEFRE